MLRIFCSNLFDPVTLNRDTYPWDIYKGIKKEVSEEEQPKNEMHVLTEADIRDIQQANNALANSIQEQLQSISRHNKMIIKRLT